MTHDPRHTEDTTPLASVTEVEIDVATLHSGRVVRAFLVDRGDRKSLKLTSEANGKRASVEFPVFRLGWLAKVVRVAMGQAPAPEPEPVVRRGPSQGKRVSP